MNVRHMAAPLVALLVLAGCTAKDKGSTGDTGPIVLGSVNTLSGPATFPEASAAAKAVFDDVNAAGGINGRQIRYETQDDKGDATAAAQAARALVDEKKTVALVGSASLLDCQVNAAYYARSKILSIPGTGIDPGCFNSSNIAPTNTGPYFGVTLMLYYASEVLKIEKLCGFFIIAGSTTQAYQDAVDAWSKLAGGKKLAINDASLTLQTTDYAPYVLRAKSAGCQGIVSNHIEPTGTAWMKAKQAQNALTMQELFLTSVYTKQFAQSLGPLGEGILALAEFTPYTINSPATADWQSVMQKHNVPLTSFAEGGYLAAKHLVKVLQGIQGSITRESVTKALREMSPIATDMTGQPFVFGPGDKHSPNQAGKVVKLVNGAWTEATPNWITPGK